MNVQAKSVPCVGLSYSIIRFEGGFVRGFLSLLCNETEVKLPRQSQMLPHNPSPFRESAARGPPRRICTVS